MILFWIVIYLIAAVYSATFNLHLFPQKVRDIMAVFMGFSIAAATAIEIEIRN